jgi:hypothetical protein
MFNIKIYHMNNFIQISNFRILMQRAYQKPETGRDTWGINAYAGLCNKEAGNSYVSGSVEHLPARVKLKVEKGLDQFIKRRSIQAEHKQQLLDLKDRIGLIGSSSGVAEIVDLALEITQPYKEFRLKV